MSDLCIPTMLDDCFAESVVVDKIDVSGINVISCQ